MAHVSNVAAVVSRNYIYIKKCFAISADPMEASITHWCQFAALLVVLPRSMLEGVLGICLHGFWYANPTFKPTEKKRGVEPWFSQNSAENF